MMASHSLKRRKLDRDHDAASSVYSSSSEEGEENTSLESDASISAPEKPRRTHPGYGHIHDGDENAIFAGSLYKSNMFKLQVDEMLAEVRPRYTKRMNVVDDALRRLKGLIERIEDRGAASVKPLDID